MACLLHLPITGALHRFEPLGVDEAVLLSTEILEVSDEEARAETSRSYAWRVATLVHMYDQLNVASQTPTRQMGGYLTLLQCWIYEYFPSVHQGVTDDGYAETTPCASRWLPTKAYMKGIKGAPYRARLDALMIMDVSWLPYTEHRAVRGFELISCYQGQLGWGHVVVYVKPKRVVRQFGYIQTIPPPPVTGSLSYEDIDDRWMHFGDHLAPADIYPFVTPTQEGDEPRHPPAPDVDAYVEPHILEVPIVVDLPRHSVVACEGCEAIAERLDRVLNLRMVTLGTKLHEIMEDCLRISRGDASDGSLRARCRQHID
ncbi:Protein MAINTENANCE OF MERISTEMS [Glycine max]|nr:Protein MAINTENANCE OF MERISTEMS [Glycine max]